MKKEDLGYSGESFQRHDRTLTTAETEFIGLLWEDHVGAVNAIAADHLAVLYRCKLEGWEPPQKVGARVLEMERTDAGRRELDRWKRDVRQMASHLLNEHDGAVILSRAGVGGGYWIAESDGEIDAFFNTMRRRGLHGLRRASRGNRQRFARVITQAVFDFDGVDGVDGVDGMVSDSAMYETVDALMERMQRDPERYAEVLRKLGARHGRVLLDKGLVEEFRAKAREMARMAEGF